MEATGEGSEGAQKEQQQGATHTGQGQEGQGQEGHGEAAKRTQAERRPVPKGPVVSWRFRGAGLGQQWVNNEATRMMGIGWSGNEGQVSCRCG